MALLVLFNPYFIDGVVDGVYGFHHDAQFLLYAPLFITAFLLQRPVLTLVFLVLFLGVKQDAAFFAVVFGGTFAVFGSPLGDYRKSGWVVAGVALVWLVASIFIVPRLIYFPNSYAAAGLSHLASDPVSILAGLGGSFTAMKWHNVFLYFIYAVFSPAAFLAALPDALMFSILPHKANQYYSYCVIIFLAFGVLTSLAWLHGAPHRFKKLAIIGLYAQIAVCIPFGGGELYHLWHKQGELGLLVRDIPAAAQADAGAMIDQSCSVSVAVPLFDHFYRLPYRFKASEGNISYFNWETIDGASAPHVRTFVSIDADWMSERGRQEDLIGPYVRENQARLLPVGRSGPLTVWADPAAPCLPWQ